VSFPGGFRGEIALARQCLRNLPRKNSGFDIARGSLYSANLFTGCLMRLPTACHGNRAALRRFLFCGAVASSLAAPALVWNSDALMSHRLVSLVILLIGLAGCGTTRWTDTARTATEQMLVSDAIERSVSRIDFKAMHGQSVFLDTTYLSTVTDKDYLISTLRQHMLASGCVMELSKERADFIVEARAGAVGTDRHDVLYGIPALN
jgi:hypothetical protein